MNSLYIVYSDFCFLIYDRIRRPASTISKYTIILLYQNLYWESHYAYIELRINRSRSSRKNRLKPRRSQTKILKWSHDESTLNSNSREKQLPIYRKKTQIQVYMIFWFFKWMRFSILFLRIFQSNMIFYFFFLVYFANSILSQQVHKNIMQPTPIQPIFW